MPAFKKDASQGKFSSVRNGQRRPDDSQTVCNLRGAAVKAEGWPSRQLPDDFNFQPIDSVADAGAEGFGCGLFGGETGGKALRGVALAQAVGLFGGKVNAVEEAPTIAVHTALDAANFYGVDSGAGNHSNKLQHPAFVSAVACPWAYSMWKSCP